MKRTDQERLLWIQSTEPNAVKKLTKLTGMTISNYIIKNRKEIDLMIDSFQSLIKENPC